MEKIFKGYGIKMDYSNDLDNSDSSENYVNKEIFLHFFRKIKDFIRKMATILSKRTHCRK